MRRPSREVTRRALLATVAALTMLWSAAAAGREPSAMQRVASELQCAAATDSATIERALDRVAHAETRALGVPADDLGAGSTMRAATLDRLLATLAAVAKRSDVLRERVERIVLSWSFCAARFDDRAWDLVAGDPPRRRAAVEPSGGWPGFRAWGFDQSHREEWGPPRLVIAGPLGPGQNEGFIHALRAERCFPSPASGHTVFADDELDPSVARPLLDEAVGGDGEAQEEGDGSCPVLPPPPHAPPPPPPLPPPTAHRTPAADKPARVEPTVVAPSAQAAGAAAGAPAPDGVTHVGGTVYTARTLQGVPAYGTRLSVSPYSFLFARVGIEARRPRKEMSGTASWGIGYDDWHPGTFYAQLNDWVIALDEPHLKGTMFDAGYRIWLPEKVAAYVGANVGVNVPWGFPAGLVSSMTFKPFGNFFGMAGVRMEVAHPSKWTWVYGFGLFDWHPFSVSAQYSNWGPNKAFLPNFLENGSVTLSVSWAF